MTLRKPEWVVDFGTICTPDYNPIQLLNSSKEMLEIFEKESRLNESHINRVLNRPFCDINKLFSIISQRSCDIPAEINDYDIYLYFCRQLFVNKISIWDTVLSPPNNPPERLIFTAITRLALDKRIYKPELEAMRYSLLYCVFNFHFNNLRFMREYIDVLKKSIIYKNPIQNNKLFRDYVDTIHKVTRGYLSAHIQLEQDTTDLSKVDYDKVYRELVICYKNVCILEKMIFYIMSGNEFCNYHIVGSLYKYDTNAYTKHPGLRNHSECNCDKLKAQVNLSGHYLSELGKATKEISKTLDEQKPCHLIIDCNPK